MLDIKMPNKSNSVVFRIIQERNIPAINFILLTQSVHIRKTSKTVSTSFNASPSSVSELAFSELRFEDVTSSFAYVEIYS